MRVRTLCLSVVLFRHTGEGRYPFIGCLDPRLRGDDDIGVGDDDIGVNVPSGQASHSYS